MTEKDISNRSENSGKINLGYSGSNIIRSFSEKEKNKYIKQGILRSNLEFLLEDSFDDHGSMSVFTTKMVGNLLEHGCRLGNNHDELISNKLNELYDEFVNNKGVTKTYLPEYLKSVDSGPENFDIYVKLFNRFIQDLYEHIFEEMSSGKEYPYLTKYDNFVLHALPILTEKILRLKSESNLEIMCDWKKIEYIISVYIPNNISKTYSISNYAKHIIINLMLISERIEREETYIIEFEKLFELSKDDYELASELLPKLIRSGKIDIEYTREKFHNLIGFSNGEYISHYDKSQNPGYLSRDKNYFGYLIPAFIDKVGINESEIEMYLGFLNGLIQRTDQNLSQHIINDISVKILSQIRDYSQEYIDNIFINLVNTKSASINGKLYDLIVIIIEHNLIDVKDDKIKLVIDQLLLNLIRGFEFKGFSNGKKLLKIVNIVYPNGIQDNTKLQAELESKYEEYFHNLEDGENPEYSSFKNILEISNHSGVLADKMPKYINKLLEKRKNITLLDIEYLIDCCRGGAIDKYLAKSILTDILEICLENHIGEKYCVKEIIPGILKNPNIRGDKEIMQTLIEDIIFKYSYGDCGVFFLDSVLPTAIKQLYKYGDGRNYLESCLIRLINISRSRYLINKEKSRDQIKSTTNRVIIHILPFVFDENFDYDMFKKQFGGNISCYKRVVDLAIKDIDSDSDIEHQSRVVGDLIGSLTGTFMDTQKLSILERIIIRDRKE